MFGVGRRATLDFVVFRGPMPEIDQAAALGAERAKPSSRRQIHRLLAGRTTRCGHDSITARSLRDAQRGTRWSGARAAYGAASQIADSGGSSSATECSR